MYIVVRTDKVYLGSSCAGYRPHDIDALGPREMGLMINQYLNI